MLFRRSLIASSVAAASIVHAAEPDWIDAHTHVFARGLKLDNYAPTYDSSWQTLMALAGRNGIGRAVILQPSFHGYDNAYLFGALKAEPGHLRGVPWISPSVETTTEAWDEMARIGVRGIHFPIFGLPTPQWPAYADMLGEALKRGWPIHLHVESERLPEMLPLLLGQCNDRSRLGGDVRRLQGRAGTRPASHADAPRGVRAGAANVGQRLAAHGHRPGPGHDLPADDGLVRRMGAVCGGAAEDPGRHTGCALRLLTRARRLPRRGLRRASAACRPAGWRCR